MKFEFEKERQDIQRKYVWTVKGTKIEDIYIWYDNNDLSRKYSSPIPSDKLDCHYITNRMLTRKIKERKAKAKNIRWNRCWSNGRIVYYQSRKRKNDDNN